VDLGREERGAILLLDELQFQHHSLTVSSSIPLLVSRLLVTKPVRSYNLPESA
jgi:hypothetical protein